MSVCFKQDWKDVGKPNGCACESCIQEKLQEWERDGTLEKIRQIARRKR